MAIIEMNLILFCFLKERGYMNFNWHEKNFVLSIVNGLSDRSFFFATHKEWYLRKISRS